MMIPFLGKKETLQAAVKVLDIVVEKGNSKEVFLKCVEGMKSIRYKRDVVVDDEDEDEDEDGALAEKPFDTTSNEKVNPAAQSVELYKVTAKGILHLPN